jgi:hypothetical protein
MFKISSLLMYSFLSGLYFFNVNVAQAFAFENETLYSIIEDESKTIGAKLGTLIDSRLPYKNPILKNCLLPLSRPKGSVIVPSTLQAIIHFFEDQDLVRHVDEPELSIDGQIRTFDHTYGLEFSGHGPVEERVIGLKKV